MSENTKLSRAAFLTFVLSLALGFDIPVIPAQAGIQFFATFQAHCLDSCLRGSDEGNVVHLPRLCKPVSSQK